MSSATSSLRYFYDTMTLQEKFDYVLKYFAKAMPDAKTELHYATPFGLLVAVILSAQCTDKLVNQVTPALLKKYPTPQKMMKATHDEIFELIRKVTFAHSKANYLLATATMLVEEYGGKIPADHDELQKLQGVGRKTASVIMSVIYNKPYMAVDTHVFRVSARIGLTKNAKNPLQTEQQLVKHIPEKLIPKAHHWLILHGRYTCTARTPKHHLCGLRDVCDYYQKEVKIAPPKKTARKKKV
jgi:endonuclease III